MLQTLLFITLNDPDLDNPDLAELIGKTVWRYESLKCHYKKPPKPSTKSRSSKTVPMSVQTRTNSCWNRWDDNVGKTHKTCKDYLASNLNGDSLSSENSSDDEGE